MVYVHKRVCTFMISLCVLYMATTLLCALEKLKLYPYDIVLCFHTRTEICMEFCEFYKVTLHNIPSMEFVMIVDKEMTVIDHH